MWNAKRSLMLSKVCTLLAAAGVLSVLLSGPWLVRWLQITSSSASRVDTPWFYATLYAGGVVALLMLFYLYRLLAAIDRDEVFVASNVSHLRRISWCCFAGAGVAAASMLYYVPWGLVALAAAFVGLIVRVVKNIIAQAILIKEENDYTI